MRKFYYRIRGDGNWENFHLKDDEARDKLAFYSAEKNITERNVGIRKGLGDRYKSESWIKQNAVLLVSIGFIILIGVLAWLYMDKWITLVGKTSDVVDKIGTLMDKQNEIMARVDTIATKGSSGIIPAPTT